MGETRFDGRVAAITGGGGGMGRAFALDLAARGAKVAVCGRRPEPLEETVAMIADGRRRGARGAVRRARPGAGGRVLRRLHASGSAPPTCS